jgi:endonuclease YncB( thermonuclease family)
MGWGQEEDRRRSEEAGFDAHNGQDVGLAQLDAGLAWWFRRYAHEQPPKDRIDYEAAENIAGE